MKVVKMPKPYQPPTSFDCNVTIGGVMIGTPCYGGQVHAHFCWSLSETKSLLASKNIPHGWIYTDAEALIQRARNRIVALFMAQKAATHLIFIDADLEWKAQDVIRLLAHGEDVICGLYPKKTEKKIEDYTTAELQSQIEWLQAHKKASMGGGTRPDPCLKPVRPADWPMHAMVDGEGSSPYNNRTGAIRISSAATGFLCIHRRVFERMAASGAVKKIESMQNLSTDALEHLYDYFWTGVEDGILWSEDYGFSRKWRQIGGQIWLDPSIKLIHMGQKAYDGDPCTLYSEQDLSMADVA